MGFDDFFGFDSDAYSVEINKLTEEELRREHAIIQKKCLSAKASVGAGAAAIMHTGGASTVISAIGLRRNSYNKQKREIIEARLNSEGWALNELRKRDILMAVGPTAVAACVLPGADAAVGHFAGDAATSFAVHHASDTVSCAVNDSSNFFHAAGEGFATQTSAMAHGLTGNAVPLIPIESVANNSTAFIGNMAGQATASTVEILAAKQGASWATKQTLGRCLDLEVAPALPPRRSDYKSRVKRAPDKAPSGPLSEKVDLDCKARI